MSLGLHGDGGLTQPVLGNFLDGAGFTATEEQHAIHVADVQFEDGREPKSVMKDVLKACKKIEPDCEIEF